MNPPLVTEERPNFAVDGDGGLATLDQLGETMDNSWVKALGPQYLREKVPVNSVIIFLKIDFKKDSPANFFTLSS
jgi:hypothetical protein